MRPDETRSIVVERVMPHAPDKVWRALTRRELLADWFMENDFSPTVGHRFTLRSKPMPGWSGVVNCEVLELEAPRRLVYRWGDGSESDTALTTTVTWTLTPDAAGTAVRMEQAGFEPRHAVALDRMGKGWPHILAGLERVAGEAEARGGMRTSRLISG